MRACPRGIECRRRVMSDMIESLSDFIDSHLVHHNIDYGTIPGFRRFRFSDLPHDVDSFDDFSKHGMPSVEMWRGNERDEKLAAVGIRASIGHREDAFGVVFQRGIDFICERVTRTAAA